MSTVRLALACALAAAALALLALPLVGRTSTRRRRLGTSGPSVAFSAALSLVAAATLWPLPPLALVASIGAVAAAVLGLRARGDQDDLAALAAWHRWLAETSPRVGALGEPLSHALWSSLREPPRILVGPIGAARGLWEVTADLPSALEMLESRAVDGVTPALCRALAGLDTLGVSEVRRSLEALTAELAGELTVAADLDARLAGARLARTLVLLVPLALAGVGVLLAGPDAFAERAATVSALVLLACWLWASHLLRPVGARPRIHGARS